MSEIYLTDLDKTKIPKAMKRLTRKYGLKTEERICFPTRWYTKGISIYLFEEDRPLFIDSSYDYTRLRCNITRDPNFGLIRAIVNAVDCKKVVDSLNNRCNMDLFK